MPFPDSVLVIIINISNSNAHIDFICPCLTAEPVIQISESEIGNSRNGRLNLFRNPRTFNSLSVLYRMWFGATEFAVSVVFTTSYLKSICKPPCINLID